MGVGDMIPGFFCVCDAMRCGYDDSSIYDMERCAVEAFFWAL